MAVIFDMDGVLFDSEPLHIRAWQAGMGPLGFSVEPQWYLRWVGIPDWELAKYLHNEHGLGASDAELLALKREHYLRITAADLRPFAGVEEGLQQLVARGTPVAVATSSNGEFCRHTLTCTGLLGYFPVRVAAEDVTAHKPAPDPFLRAAALLGTPPNACTVIEDSPTGIRAARAAGCRVLAVTSSYPAETLGEADEIFATTALAIQRVLETR